MLLNSFTIIIASVICAILYRMGGADKPYASWMRDWLIPPVVIATVSLITAVDATKMFHYWWVYFLTWGIMGGCLSAYWGQDEKKYGFFWHGLGIALSIAPISIINGHWLAFLIRLIILPVLMAWWSEKQNNAVKEELGRGILIGLTLMTFLIGA